MIENHPVARRARLEYERLDAQRNAYIERREPVPAELDERHDDAYVACVRLCKQGYQVWGLEL